MTPEEIQRTKELFAEAIDLPPEAAQALVERAGREEPESVTSRLREMLNDFWAAEEAGFLQSPAVPPNAFQDTVAEAQRSPHETVDFVTSDSYTPRQAGEQRPGLLADDYEILEELGKGGMGTVYRAHQHSLNRDVAIKIIPKQFIHSPQDAARFYLEAEAAAKLDHPGIVAVQDVGERSGVHYYTMPLITGGGLDRFVDQAERLTRQRSAELIEAVARAVQYAHDRAVIHRDIKPANILLDEAGHPRLTDFGLAKMTNAAEQLTMTGQVMGTPSYMAPEQAEGDTAAISTHTDIYSLGATLYALLAGKPPFAGNTLFQTLEQVRRLPPATLPDSVPIDLRTICQKCLEKDPRDRYASADDLADDLRRYLDGFPIAARPTSRLRQATAWARRNPMEAVLWSTVAALLVAATVVSTLLYLRAEHHLDLAEAEADKLEAAIDDTLVLASEELLVDAPGMDATRRTLLQNAQQYFEGQLADGRLAPAKVAGIAARLGKTQFALGELDEAELSFQRAIKLYEQQLKTAPPDDRWRLTAELAQVHREYAELGQTRMTIAREFQELDEQQLAHGLSTFAQQTERCYQLRREVAEARPDDVEAQRLLANAEMNLATAHSAQYSQNSNSELLDAAATLLDSAEERRLAMEPSHPEPAKVKLDLALGHEARAQLLLQQAQEKSEAEADPLNKQALRERLAAVSILGALPAASLNRQAVHLAATALQNCGESYHEIGRDQDAIECFRRMEAYRKQLLASNPGVTDYRLGLARAHYDLHDLLRASDNHFAAQAEFLQCAQVLAEGMIPRPDDAQPLALLQEFTDHSARQLVKVGLIEQAFDQINVANDALHELPPSRRELPSVQQAIERLKDLSNELAQQLEANEA